MKSLMFFLGVMLIGAVINGQENNRVPVEHKSFVMIHAGGAFPASDFNSKDFNNPEAGLANIGFALKGQFSYLFVKNFGITTGLFFNINDLNHTAVEKIGSDVHADHWQSLGIEIGPLFSYAFTPKIAGDMQFTIGAARCNSPSITEAGVQIFLEDWSWTEIYKGGGALRFDIGKNVFAVLNADYSWMRPRFTLKAPDGEYSEKIHQHIDIFGLTGGVGFKF